ncbi:MAG: DMT family transporter [Rickettsiales bacterium]|nr:DMT family transporter [Pseudomonadota bacterium]MDA0967598.1 DMT family transporter [Pseudomonadota bacterium]MDG4544373.1 DMT family transporter [Rickettsiales bacterium]MDG4546503.1 DMT family transporter [Rickettsiales bacterium]MDG4548661.1 DMT family transporter [Rickettsiales bacterium]
MAYFVLHCFLFSCIGVLTKYAMQSGLSIVQILLFQTGTACVALFLFNRKKLMPFPKKKSILAHITRAFFWLVATALFFMSLDKISLPSATALSFSTPLFTIILAIVILKEVMRKYYYPALSLGFFGMLIIVQPASDSFQTQSFMVIGACILWSITDIIIKRMGIISDTIKITWYFSLFSFLMLLPFVVSTWITPTFTQLCIMLLIGVFFIFNMLTLTYAYSIGTLTVIQPFAFMSLVFTSVMAYIAFGEIIKFPTIVGSIIIVASTSFIAYQERKRHKEWLAYRIGEEIL